MKNIILAEAHRRKKARLGASLALMLTIGMAELCLFYCFSMGTVHTASVPPSGWPMTYGTTPW